MPRYIRYLENGEYKYASVKPVGDIEKLKIDAPDLVTAINSLVDGGVIELVQGKVDELQHNIDNVNSTVTSQGQTIQQQAVTIENQSQLVYQLQVDMIDTKKLQGDLQASQSALQADYEQTVADLSKTKADLEKKLDYSQYQDQYSALIEQLSNKAESIDVQSIVDSLNQDITHQTMEVDQAKTDIVNLDTKVDAVKTDVLTNIDNVQSNVDALNKTVADQRADTLSRISDVQTKATNDLNTAKAELNSSISSVQQSVTDLNGKVDTVKTDLTNKINADILNANNAIDAVEERVSQSEADISTAKSNIATAQQSISQTQSDLSATKQDLANTKTDLANTKTNLQGQIDNTKQSVTDLTGRISDSEQDISDINTDIANVKQSILTTQSNLSGTQQDLADAKEELQGSITTVQQKADANAQAIQGINGDITTINSDIDTINGQISTTITDVTSLKGRVSTAESNITENANQIATKVSQLTYDTDMKGVKDRITNTESTLVQQAGLIASKVEQTDYNALEGRVTSQQTTIEQMADQIAQKVEHSEYDELTQQVSTQETSILQSASDIQLLASRATSAEGRLDSAETAIQQNADAIKLKAEASSVYNKSDVDSKLGTKVDTKTYSDKIAEIELNANSITQRVSDTEGDIDAISGNVTTLQSNVSTLQQASTQIQSTVSGIQEDVSDLDGRLDSAETQITQNKNAITLKADKTTVDTLSGRVDDAESQLSVQADQIATKVEKTTYTTDKTNLQNDINSRAKQSDLNATNNNLSNLAGRVTTAESSITENANEIATKVAQSDYDRDISGLTTRISSAETSITENANAIALKASQSSVDDLNKSIANAQAELIVQANQIASKVEQSTYDELNSRVVNQQTTIEQMADQISQKVEHSEYDELTNQVATQETSILQTASDVQILATKSEDLDGRLSTAEASIVTQAGQIALKAESKDVYTKSDVDTKLGTKVDNSTYQTKMSEIDVTTSGITQRVEATEGDIDTITGNVSNIKSDVSTLQQTSTQIQSTVTGIQSDVDGLDNRLSTAETNITQNKNDIALRAKQTDLDAVTGRVSNAESQLSVQAGQIASKVEQTTYTNDKKALQDSIATKANATDLTALTGRVTTAESTITQQANQIQQKVNTTDVYLKGDVDTMLANGNIYVRGTGLNHGGNRVLKINGKTIYDEGGRGFRLTTINRSTLAVVDNILYDVYGSDQPKNDLADKLNSLDTSVLVVLTSYDAIATNSALDTAIANFGGTGTRFGGSFHRVPYALVGMKGIGKGAGIEVFTSVDATATPVAEISTKIVNGIPQGFNTSVTALDKRVTTAETTITQQANAISLKANASDVYTKSDVDTKLGTKVDSTTYNNKVAEIKVTTDNISSNVSSIQSTVNTQTGQITQLNSDVSAVDQKANSIQSTVTSLSSMVDSQGQKISQHDTSITQLNNSISLKANASDVYTKTQADGATTTAINNAKAEIKVTTDAISSNVASLQQTTSDHEQRLVSQQTSVEQLADQISQKVEYSDYDQLNQQVSVQETQILQTSSDIELLANRTTQAEGRLDVAEASIKLNSDSIATKVEKTDFDNLKGTVTSQGTSITQLNNQIALKAEASNVYTKSQTDSMVNAKVDTSTYNSKISEIKVTTDGISQSVSNLSSSLDTTNSNVSAVNQKADSIQSTVTSLSDTVTSQGNTISSHTTSITQLNNSISLKANASDVYTKSDTDSKLGTKVDTTTYNNKVAEIKATTDSISSSVSNTNAKIDNLQIGGRNYYKMKSFQGAGGVTAVFDGTANVWNVTIPNGSTSSWRGIAYNAKNAILRAGRTYTVSFEVYADSVIPLYADINNQGLTTNVSGNDNDVTSKRIYNFPNTVAGRWTKASFTFTMPDTITQDFYDYSTLGVANGWKPTADTTIKIKNMKLEEGNRPTDWQPAVEDMNDNFDALSQNISSVNQKADSIQSSVSSLTSTVNDQGTRLTNAETTITQHTNSINLKANASDVYTKTQVDTSLGKKVDTTTYNNKMSSIDVSINGINQTVSDQSTSINNLNGTVTDHTSKISSVQQQADNLSSTVTQVQSDLSGLTGRVSTAETKITQNTNAIALKASQSSVDSLGTRVSNAESTLSVQSGQIASKVAQTDYDEAVGVNKWVARRYDMQLASSSVVPTFDHIKGKTPSAVIDYPDNANLDAFDGDYYMTHYFTNVYMKSAKTITLTVTNDDGASIFLNGASIYGKGSTGTTSTSVSVAFRAGWNTFEILHYEHTGAEKVSLGLSISSQVDKMTSVIGVGNKDETRLTQAETSIIQTNNAITLKADKTDVTALGNRVTSTESSITVLNNQIASKVNQTDFDAYAQRLSTAESNITQNADAITTLVKKSDFDNLNSRVTTAESSITQLNNAITLKANQTSVDSLAGRITTAEGTLTTQANQIASKVSQATFDALTIGARNYMMNGDALHSRTTPSGTAYDELSVSSDLLSMIKKGSSFIISYDLSTSSLTKGTTNPYIGIEIKYTATDGSDNYLSYNLAGTSSMPSGTSSWNRYSKIQTVAKDAQSIGYVRAYFRDYTGTASIKNIKLEFGTLATEFSLAPEDTDGKISNITIGGRNLVLGAGTAKTATGTGGTNQCTNIYNIDFSKVAGKEITMSFDIVSSVNSGTCTLQWNNTPWGTLSGSIPVSTTSQHIVKTVLQPPSGSATGVQLRLDNVTGTVTISNLKIELGNKATDFTVAPEDTDSTISSISGRLTTAESSITQQANSISLKANASDVYTKSQTDNAIAGSVNSAKSEIKVTTDGISSNVSSLQSIVANNSQQLIRNSTFTDGTNGLNYWTVASGYWSLDTSKAVDGSNAMLAVVTGQTADAWKQIESEYIDVKAGQKINGSWYTMIDDSTLDEGRGYNMELEFYNASGTRLSASGKSIKPSAVNTWQRFDYTTTAPTGSVKARLRAHPTRNGKIWVSRPMLVLGDTPPSAFSVMPNESVLKGMNASIDTLNNSITSKVTQTDINNSISAIRIGARNLIYNSTGKLSDGNNQALGWSANTISDVVDGKPALRVDNSSSGETTRSSNTIAVKPSTTYVLKGLVKGTTNAKGYDIFWLGKKSGSSNSYDYVYNITGSLSRTGLTPTSELVFTTKSDEVSGYIRIDNNGTDGTAYKDDDGVTDITYSTVWFSELQLEEGTKGTAWKPAVEDLYDQIDGAYARISSAEEKITDDAIINTVSTTIQNAVEGKADASDLAGYATSGDLDNAIAQMGNDVDAKLSALDYVTPSVLATELDQTNKDFEFKIQQSGGVNLIRNSVGFADIADSPVWTLNGTVNTIQSDELEQLGFGSGFYVPKGVAGYIDQNVNVNAGDIYTLSFYMKKTIDSSTNGWAGIDVYDGGTKITFRGLGAGAGTTSDGYQQFVYTFTPKTGQVMIHVTVGSNADAIITGLMLNVGEHPRQWSMANGEVYNTNVKVDINGIKVLSNQYEGFTAISPEEFAGYASVADETTGIATMTKVFTLNKDVTEMSKVDVDKEIAMNPIRIVPIQTGNNNGWAFLPSV